MGKGSHWADETTSWGKKEIDNWRRLRQWKQGLTNYRSQPKPAKQSNRASSRRSDTIIAALILNQRIGKPSRTRCLNPNSAFCSSPVIKPINFHQWRWRLSHSQPKNLRTSKTNQVVRRKRTLSQGSLQKLWIRKLPWVLNHENHWRNQQSETFRNPPADRIQSPGIWQIRYFLRQNQFQWWRSRQYLHEIQAYRSIWDWPRRNENIQIFCPRNTFSNHVWLKGSPQRCIHQNKVLQPWVFDRKVQKR